MPGSIGGIASGVGSLINGVIGSNAQGSAVQAAKQATAQNNGVAQAVYNTNSNNLQPFNTAGQTATQEELGLLGLGGNSNAANQAFQTYLNSTPYQFQFTQGANAVNTANAQSFNSGANEKALEQFGQGLAGSALSNYQGQLTNLTNTGVQAGSALGSLGTQYANQIASNNNNLASVQGGAAIGAANAQENALNGVLSGATSAYQNYTQPNSLQAAVSNGTFSAAPGAFSNIQTTQPTVTPQTSAFGSPSLTTSAPDLSGALAF